jgi:hypothetical protein
MTLNEYNYISVNLVIWLRIFLEGWEQSHRDETSDQRVQHVIYNVRLLYRVFVFHLLMLSSNLIDEVDATFK